MRLHLDYCVQFGTPRRTLTNWRGSSRASPRWWWSCSTHCGSRDWENWTCLTWRREGWGKAFTVHTSPSWGVTGKTELRAYWMCIAKGEKFQMDIWKKISWEYLTRGTGCSEKWWDLHTLETLNTWAELGPEKQWSNLETSSALSSNSSSTLAFGIPFP